MFFIDRIDVSGIKTLQKYFPGIHSSDSSGASSMISNGEDVVSEAGRAENFFHAPRMLLCAHFFDADRILPDLVSGVNCDKFHNQTTSIKNYRFITY